MIGRYVWLDRGELNKIIKRDRDRNYGSQQKPYRKKKSLLGELFDF